MKNDPNAGVVPLSSAWTGARSGATDRPH